MEKQFEVEEVSRVLGYAFKNEGLLRQALTHSSASVENTGQASYERLELLGDSVLQLAVTRYLFDRYPAEQEGRLSRVRAAAVSEPALAQAARGMDLGRFLVLGRGAERNAGRDNDSILADVVEAVLAVIYLEAGLETATQWILPRVTEAAETAMEEGTEIDAKSRLQETLQRNGEAHIEYAVIHEEGPPHARVFTVSLRVDRRELAQGTGNSKKKAEQHAAKIALALSKE